MNRPSVRLAVVTLSLSLGLNIGCQRSNGVPSADPGEQSTFADESAPSGNDASRARYDDVDSSGSGGSFAATSTTATSTAATSTAASSSAGKSPGGPSTTDFDGTTSGFGDGKPPGFGNQKPATNRAPGFDGKTKDFAP